MNQLRAAGDTGCLPHFFPAKEVLILTITLRMLSSIFSREANYSKNWLLTLQLLPDFGGRELQVRLQNRSSLARYSITAKLSQFFHPSSARKCLTMVCKHHKNLNLSVSLKNPQKYTNQWLYRGINELQFCQNQPNK